MDFSDRLDALQQRAAAAKAEVKAAGAESREQLRQRINHTQSELDQSAAEPQQGTKEATTEKRSEWAKIKADAAAKTQDIKARIDKRNRQMDSKMAASEADWAESGAIDALDFADWAAHNAQLAVLDAIDARAYADELASTSPS